MRQRLYLYPAVHCSCPLNRIRNWKSMKYETQASLAESKHSKSNHNTERIKHQRLVSSIHITLRPNYCKAAFQLSVLSLEG